MTEVKLFYELTKLALATGKIAVSCENCGLSFEKYACHAKRVKAHFCSKDCHNKFRERKVSVACSVCGAMFEVIPSQAKPTHVRNAKKVTCSKKCAAAKKREFLLAEAENMHKSSVFHYGQHERGEEISKKLTWEAVRRIRADTRPQAAIAADFGVTQGTISLIKRGRTWVEGGGD